MSLKVINWHGREIHWPDWAPSVHTERTDGTTCNCPDCVTKRGFFLCTKPIKPGELKLILHVREPEKTI